MLTTVEWAQVLRLVAATGLTIESVDRAQGLITLRVQPPKP